MLVQKFFTNLFHLIIAVSRLIDIHPLEELKTKMKKFQKISASCQLICELVAPNRPIQDPALDYEEEK
jgi:hypothetical protein